MTEEEADQIMVAELLGFWLWAGPILLGLILLAVIFRRQLSAGLDQLLAALGLLEPEES